MSFFDVYLILLGLSMVLVGGESESQDHQKGKRSHPQCLSEGAHLFVLATQNQNNYTETIVIKSLLGPLALDYDWLTLAS